MSNTVRLELNSARAAYNDTRITLGHLNKVIGTKRIGHFQVEISNEVLNQLKRDKSRIFGEMNKSRARLKRAIRSVVSYLKTRSDSQSYV